MRWPGLLSGNCWHLAPAQFPGLQICADRGFVGGGAPRVDDADVDLAGAHVSGTGLPSRVRDVSQPSSVTETVLL